MTDKHEASCGWLNVLDETASLRVALASAAEPYAAPCGDAHIYQGLCPDDVSGWGSRDPDCPACSAIARAQPTE